MKHVGVNIVTGFLGSGKTTLIGHAMRGPLARPDVVFIVNEIGEIGLDGRVLTGFVGAERMVELSSGCICCSIEDARFDMAVAQLVDRFDPALLVIETTGVADPRPLEERISRAGLGLDAVITVVDAENFSAAWRTRVGRAQVRAADFLVVNKTDLCSGLAIRRVRRRLTRKNGRAGVFEAVKGNVPSDLLFGVGITRLRLATDAGAGEPDHLGADGISALSLRAPGALDKARFERFLRRLPASILRAKGVVRFADTPWRCIFNYTCGRYELSWVRWQGGPDGSEAVFIGCDIERSEAALRSGLAGCELD
jgi:cobalamin biosynthesis protein CobW